MDFDMIGSEELCQQFCQFDVQVGAGPANNLVNLARRSVTELVLFLQYTAEIAQ